jgi:3'(2'), 5'-bisphosphate nucleotidase
MQRGRRRPPLDHAWRSALLPRARRAARSLALGGPLPDDVVPIIAASALERFSAMESSSAAPGTPLLASIVALAERAGRSILALYGQDSAVDAKADGSPVTAADRAAHDVIIAALRDLTPQTAAISEEGLPASGARALPARFWLVDPLDGTKEYIKRNGEFTVNIALIAEGVPVLGVVHVPVLAETYAGEQPATAYWRKGDAPPRTLAVRAAPAEGLTVLASRSHADRAALDGFLAKFRVKEFRQAGSSLKFCLIARAAADYYPRLGPTMEWDTAAGQAVLEAAGGSVLTLDGARLRYGKADFRNPHFVAQGVGYHASNTSDRRPE